MTLWTRVNSPLLLVLLLNTVGCEESANPIQQTNSAHSEVSDVGAATGPVARTPQIHDGSGGGAGEPHVLHTFWPGDGSFVEVRRLQLLGAGSYAVDLSVHQADRSRPFQLARRTWTGCPVGTGILFRLEDRSSGEWFEVGVGAAPANGTADDTAGSFAVVERAGTDELLLEVVQKDGVITERYVVGVEEFAASYGSSELGRLGSEFGQSEAGAGVLLDGYGLDGYGLEEPPLSLALAHERFAAWYQPPEGLTDHEVGERLSYVLTSADFTDWLHVELESAGFEDPQDRTERSFELACVAAGVTAVLKCPFGGGANPVCVRALATTLVCLFVMMFL